MKDDTLETIEAKYEKAKAAYEKWCLVTLNTRIEALNRFYDALDKKREELAITISEEIGKPLWESRQEVQSTLSKIAISIDAYKIRTMDSYKEVGLGRISTRFKPVGITAVIGPFNFPIHLPNGHIIASLLAGNSVLFKPSEKAIRVAELYHECWIESGNPRDLLQLIIGDGKAAELLISLPIDALYFTGSLNVGMKISKALSERPQVLLALEMGGMNPLVISDVSDIHAASYLTIQSSFITSGQRCTAARKLIVIDGPKQDAYLKELLQMTKSIKVGPYTDKPEPFMGELINEQAADAVFDSFQKQKGKILFPMQRLSKRLLTPGIIEVNPLDIKDEEVFGPLLYLIRVKNLEEAIQEANRSRYGLVAGIFTDKAIEYETFYYSVKAGVINWNAPLTGASSLAPFGGVKMSGNYRPAAFFASDYTSYPVASTEISQLQIPSQILPGIQGVKK